MAESPASEPRLTIEPTCLCGCSKTRSKFAGDTARLGTVVPGTVIARLLEAERVAARPFSPSREIDFHSDVEPIPI
jgi:hypothetical protein